jgi:hypothetical protein
MGKGFTTNEYEEIIRRLLNTQSTETCDVNGDLISVGDVCKIIRGFASMGPINEIEASIYAAIKDLNDHSEPIPDSTFTFRNISDIIKQFDDEVKILTELATADVAENVAIEDSPFAEINCKIKHRLVELQMMAMFMDGDPEEAEFEDDDPEVEVEDEEDVEEEPEDECYENEEGEDNEAVSTEDGIIFDDKMAYAIEKYLDCGEMTSLKESGNAKIVEFVKKYPYLANAIDEVCISRYSYKMAIDNEIKMINTIIDSNQFDEIISISVKESAISIANPFADINKKIYMYINTMQTWVNNIRNSIIKMKAGASHVHEYPVDDNSSIFQKIYCYYAAIYNQANKFQDIVTPETIEAITANINDHCPLGKAYDNETKNFVKKYPALTSAIDAALAEIKYHKDTINSEILLLNAINNSKTKIDSYSVLSTSLDIVDKCKEFKPANETLIKRVNELYKFKDCAEGKSKCSEDIIEIGEPFIGLLKRQDDILTPFVGYYDKGMNMRYYYSGENVPDYLKLVKLIPFPTEIM